jgi:hypothetical protein
MVADPEVVRDRESRIRVAPGCIARGEARGSDESTVRGCEGVATRP